MPDRILLVDDDVAVIKTMARMLAGIGEIQIACSGFDAMRVIRETPPSLILLDAEMPGMSGFQVCELLKADPSLADIPVIFVTSHGETSVEVAGFEIGAVDFISKPVSPALLLARVKTQLRIKHLSDELRRSAYTDGLTQVANRRSFDDAFRREWLRAVRSAEPTSVLMIDVDHFKLYNDRHGHGAGDRCLQGIAQALVHACLRPADLVARYGGEEFVMLLPATARAGAAHVAARVQTAVEAMAIEHGASKTDRHVTVSVGMTSYDSASPGWVGEACESRFADDLARPVKPSQLLKAADLALYAAKQAGRAQSWMLDAGDVDFPERAHEVPPLGSAAWASAAA